MGRWGQHGKVLCRLDRFYLYSSFKKAVSKVFHSRVLVSISDHYFVVLYLAGRKLGKGFWKCNVSVLEDVDLKSDIKVLWESHLKRVEDEM